MHIDVGPQILPSSQEIPDGKACESVASKATQISVFDDTSTLRTETAMYDERQLMSQQQ